MLLGVKNSTCQELETDYTAFHKCTWVLTWFSRDFAELARDFSCVSLVIRAFCRKGLAGVLRGRIQYASASSCLLKGLLAERATCAPV